MTMSEALRIITILLVFFVCCAFPWATITQGRKRSAIWAVVGAELVLLSSLIAILVHFGDQLRWWRTPLVFVGSICMTVYILKVWHERV